MQKILKLQVMIEIAFMAALAFVLDLVIPSFQPIPSVYINFSMIPVFIIAFRRGVVVSALTGLIWGLLQIVTAEAYFLHPIQVILEYVIALPFIAVAGLFMNQIQSGFRDGEKKKGLTFAIIAIIAGSLSRYFWHFIAGFVFWTETFGMSTSAGIVFSLWTNALSAVLSGILCAFVIFFLLSTGPRLVYQSIKS